MQSSAHIRRSANSEQSAESGYSLSIAAFLGEMREKWDRLLAPLFASLCGQRAIDSLASMRKTVDSVLALAPSSLRYTNDTRSEFDWSTKALKGIVKTSARPEPAIPSSYLTRSASIPAHCVLDPAQQPNHRERSDSGWSRENPFTS